MSEVNVRKVIKNVPSEKAAAGGIPVNVLKNSENHIENRLKFAEGYQKAQY